MLRKAGEGPPKFFLTRVIGPLVQHTVQVVHYPKIPPRLGSNM